MIYTDRKYNKTQKLTRQEQIKQMEAERDALFDQLMISPGACSDEEVRHFNYLESQIEIMKGNKIFDF